LAASLAQADPPRKITTIEGITEYRLDNGLIVLLYPERSQPTITTSLTVFVGSRHEGYGETGMAHLLEHMLFKGTPTHPRVDMVLRERGASYNGTTNDDRTNYFETLPASDDNLEFAIRFEADRLMNSLVRREDLLSEMTVVRNEFERGENSPSRILSQRMMGVAFEWHNYGKSTIGNRSDIERVPIENLQSFYRQYYQPDNAMFVVAGKFDEAKALEHIQKYFGSIPRPKRTLPTTYTEEPPQDGERTVVLRRVGDVGLVGAVYHIPAGSHEDFAPLQILASVLTAAPSGKLYKALVETKKATDVSGFASGQYEPGVINFSAEVPKESSLEEVRDTLLAIVEGLGSEPVAAEEVQRVKLQFRNARRQSQANAGQFAVQLSNWAAQGDWRLYFVHRDRVENVTPADVQRVAARYLQRNNRTVGLFIPTEQPQRTTIPKTPDIETLVANYKGSETITAGEVFDPTYENIDARTQRTTLPGGIRVALLPKKTRNEMAYVTLTLRFGTVDNLRGLTAAESFLPALMTRATKQLTRQQLQDELAKLDARIGAGGIPSGRGRRGGGDSGAGVGSVSFYVSARRESLPQALELFRQVLREPLLPADEFEQMKLARLASLQQQRTEPDALASRLLARELSPFGKDDPRYVPSFEEEEEILRSVTMDQVRQLYEDYLGAGAGELTIVGDFDPAPTLEIIAKSLDGWKAKHEYARLPEPSPPDVAGGKHVIRTPDKANATYLAALPVTMQDDDPDYPALVIANFVLGRGPGSRLWDRVREREGVSYGVGSSFSASAEHRRASVRFNAICNPANMDRVETAMREEIERIVREGIPANELEKAKASYLQQRQIALASEAAIGGLLATSSYLGRPLTYHIELDKRIAALTPDQVAAAVKKHLAAKKLVVVMAGDFGAAAGGK
jgi:zinc protease